MEHYGNHSNLVQHKTVEFDESVDLIYLKIGIRGGLKTEEFGSRNSVT